MAHELAHIRNRDTLTSTVAAAVAGVSSPHGYPDPMLGAGAVVADNQEHGRRMGDRILVLKSLYPFIAPKRFDVVVFKNPTDPTGRSANYIKRLIGLPNEQVLLRTLETEAGGAP